MCRLRVIGENTGVLEDIRFISDQIMYDTLSEGKRKNNKKEGSISNPTPSPDATMPPNAA